MNRRELAEHRHEIDFEPKECVRWLAPAELKTWLASVLSLMFGVYSDKRELQAAFEASVLDLSDFDLHGDDDFWFDHAADTGDGFDATFTVATLLAQPALAIEGVDKPLPRGELLVLGGDEVYPAASASAYEDRTIGPFRSAFPWAEKRPALLALPGNHDWYDGLTAFLRIFCQGRSFGGWQTVQTRSYFTAKLPHGWWLIGLDSQLTSYFDEPQLRYFEETLTQQLQPGDGVIVCCASPAWMKIGDGNADAFNSLDWFERKFVRTRRTGEGDERESTGATVRLWLTGDKHHYMRFAEELTDPDAAPGSARQLITCGLGGAFLEQTHGFADEIELLPPESRTRRRSEESTVFRRAAADFPAVEDSRKWERRLAQPWRKEWAVRRNPGQVSAFAMFHLLGFLGQLFVFGQGANAGSYRIYDRYLDAPASVLLEFVGAQLVVAAVILALICGPMVRGRPPLVSLDFTTVIGSQWLLCLAGFVGIGLAPTDSLDLVPRLVLLSVCLIAYSFIFGVAGASLFALWIVVFRDGALGSWAIMGQAIEEGKGFLRIRIAPDGDLTIHPLVTDTILREYTLTFDLMRSGEISSARIPVPAEPIPTPRLIEPPFVVRRSPARSETRSVPDDSL